jgi:hypothetical protein
LTSDLVGVNRDIIEHQLQVSPNAKPKKLKLRIMVGEKIQAAKAEVQRLLDAGFIREVTYPEWLSNVVMVKKKNGKWWICMDFIELNKCCLKDDFLLARIDQIVDSAAASEMMSLSDCFSGYHQSGFGQRMKKIPVSSSHSECIATSKSRRGSAMQDPPFAE